MNQTHRTFARGFILMAVAILSTTAAGRALAQSATAAPTTRPAGQAQHASSAAEAVTLYFDAIRADRLESAIDTLLDVPAMSERMAGDEWQRLSPEQRSVVADSLKKILTVSWKLPGLRDAFATSTLNHKGEKPQPDGRVQVDYVISLKEPRPTELQNSAMVRRDATGWRIIDLRTGPEQAQWMTQAMNAGYQQAKRADPQITFADFFKQVADGVEAKLRDGGQRGSQR